MSENKESDNIFTQIIRAHENSSEVVDYADVIRQLADGINEACDGKVVAQYEEGSVGSYFGYSFGVVIKKAELQRFEGIFIHVIANQVWNRGCMVQLPMSPIATIHDVFTTVHSPSPCYFYVSSPEELKHLVMEYTKRYFPYPLSMRHSQPGILNENEDGIPKVTAKKKPTARSKQKANTAKKPRNASKTKP